MGGSHAAHRHSDDAEVALARLPRRILLGALALAGVAAVVGMFLLWPQAADAPPSIQFFGTGVSQLEAEVTSLSDPCPVVSADPDDPVTSEPRPQHCDELTVRVTDGPERGSTQVLKVPPDISRAGLVSGDVVEVERIPPTGSDDATYSFVGVDRDLPIGLMAALFVLVVAVVARLRGVLALLGLGFSGLVLAKFMLPALLAGESGVGVALVGASVIMFVVLYLAHGLSVRTSTALAGTLVGIAITAGLGIWAVSAARLSGIGDDTGQQLLLYAEDVNYAGLLTCAVIIAGLGVLNDVTITQASSVWELRAASPQMSRPRLFAAGMRIGRDHIASTIYTIVFVYAGTALVLLLLISLYDRPLLGLISDEAIAEEVVRTLASAIGLVLAVPVTTAIAVLMVPPSR